MGYGFESHWAHNYITSSMEELKFKDLVINLNTKVCFVSEKEINLTKTEYSLLVFLLSNRNKIHTRKEIMQSVWENSVSNRAIDTTISRLRKKLGPVGRHITTRLGFGYGFIE